jgi:hypothetical protein
VRRLEGDFDRDYLWLGVQFHEAKTGTLRVIHHVPLAIVVHVRTVAPFWAAGRAGAPSAVTPNERPIGLLHLYLYCRTAVLLDRAGQTDE